MSGRWEFLFYVSVGAGMAFATSSFTMMSGLFEVATGSSALLAIVLAAAFCAVISCSIGELASMYPSAPGVRTYLKAALGNRISLFLVHLYLIFIVVMAGVESYVFTLVVGALWPQVSPLGVVLALLACVVGANVAGLGLPRWLEVLATAVLMALVIGFGAYGVVTAGAGWGGPWRLDAGAHVLRLPAAAAMAVFLFIGFEWVTPLGLSPRSYERKIPLSMPAAIALALVAYGCFALGLSAQLPRDAIVGSPTPHVPYFVSLLGGPGLYVAVLVSLLATFSTFNAGVMGSARLIYALAREGNLPAPLARMSPETGAPVGAVLLLGALSGLSAVVVIVGDLALEAAVVGSAIVCCLYAAFMLSVIRLRKLQPQRRRSYRTPVPPWIQWAVVVIMPVMAAQSLLVQQGRPYQPAAGMMLCVVMALGLTWLSIVLAARQQEGYEVSA